jgi:large subunit ribosomal protein L18
LSIRRSNKHIYCQLIDDEAGRTLASASTRDKTLAGQIDNGGNREAAKLIGQSIAERAKAIGVTRIRFDRGAYRYHGRVAELADAARAGGLEF